MPNETNFHIFRKNVNSPLNGTTRHVGNVASTRGIKSRRRRLWLVGKREKCDWMQGHDNSQVCFSYE